MSKNIRDDLLQNYNLSELTEKKSVFKFHATVELHHMQKLGEVSTRKDNYVIRPELPSERFSV